VFGDGEGGGSGDEEKGDVYQRRDWMSALTKIMNGIFAVLFIEAILFLPIVFMVAFTGNELIRTMKYAGLFLVAFMPYLIWRKIKPTISMSRRNIILMVLGLMAGICFLLSFSGLILVSCAGHPPF
jgi:hypothetical protein